MCPFNIFHKAKNNQFENACKASISQTRSSFCPVAIILTFIQNLKMFPWSFNDNVFPSLTGAGVPIPKTVFSVDIARKNILCSH